MGSTIYTEVFVLALVLISNVLGNNFIGYIPKTATEIAARPQVPSPKLLFKWGNSANKGWAVLPFNHCSNRLIVTCGGMERNKCT